MSEKLSAGQRRLVEALEEHKRGEYDGFVSVVSHRTARYLKIATDPEDAGYPPRKYRGEWLHVNERGNCVLYYRNSKGKDREIASCV